MWKRLFFIRRPDYINLSAKKEKRHFIKTEKSILTHFCIMDMKKLQALNILFS